MGRKLLSYLSLVLLLLGAARPGWGQGATTAAMSGTITDAKGEALPGATIIALHTPTNTEYATPTNADGRFSIQNMRVGGPYTVRVVFVGYQDFTRTGINLTLAENYRLDVKLGESSTALAEVTITGRQNPVINADRTGAATTIQRSQIERLPTINRTIQDYTRLTPQAGANGSFGGRNNLYNNITIDGALFNNAFGLSGTIGGQANAQPISLDAIDQLQVSIAPYDVRLGSFTGAGINAVTRSGTNSVAGSIYYFYRNQRYVGTHIADVDNTIANFNLQNFGFRVGGPIVKDKLFFFLNGEREVRSDPPTGNFAANRGTAGPTVSGVSAQDLDVLSNFLTTKYGYSPGPYEGYSLASNSTKLTAKLDWNISKNHRFNIKYNYLKSYRDVTPSGSGGIGSNRSQSQYGLPYLGAYYRINNNLNSYIAELNSTFGSKFSNNLTAGFLANRDYREGAGGSAIPQFPLVDIGNSSGLSAVGTRVTAAQTLTSFGYEPFSAFNLLNTDTYQLGDNFTAFLGKHSVTLGTYNELYKFTNGFAPQYYGQFLYNSLQDFYASAATSDAPYGYNYANGQYTARTATEGLRGANEYLLRYSALSDGSFPFAVTNAAQIGLYLQDEFSPAPNFKLTVGLRGDLPIIYSDIQQNTNLANLPNFRDGIRLNTSQVPNRTILFSPRAGFNWDVFDNRKTQVRGGSGIFTGRVPYVWISNQASNNGVQFGSVDFAGSAATSYSFNPNVDAYRTQLASGGANTSYNIAATAKDFKFPQVWRSNLAIDHELGGGIIGTLEALYTRDINAVYFQNVDLPVSTANATAASGDPSAAGGDRRPIFYTRNTAAGATTALNANPYYRIYGQNPDGSATTATAANPAITDAILLNNTNKGYSYSLTAQLQKTFSNGLYAMAAYTYTDSRSVNDGGSVAQSSWAGRPVSGDPNADVLGYSSYLISHRVIGSLSYRVNYLKVLGTTFSLFYEGAPAGRYSYTYSGDMNGDGVRGNDLMYIPRDASDIVLTNRTLLSGTPDQYVYTAAQQHVDLENFINADPYLSAHRGEYAVRNAAVQPWQHRVDFRLLQDIFIQEKTRNALQFSIDIFNVGNLINRNWGVYQYAYTASPLAFQSYDAQGRPQFQFQYAVSPTRTTNASGSTTVTSAQTLTTPFRNDVTTLASRWQAQIGLRYLFN